MIKHDKKWLDNIDCLAVSYCEEYLAHMTRWRTMDEVPEIGSRIEILERNDYGDPITYNMIFNNEMPDIALGWRPAPLGELPEVSDAA